jgi:photosystem II stability/assembly factor-like uncharacterized protein
VVVGDQGEILTSSKGTSWKARKSGTMTNLRVVKFANGGFEAGSVDGITLASDEGKVWHVRNEDRSLQFTRVH